MKSIVLSIERKALNRYMQQINTTHWMGELAQHYQLFRANFPDDPLMVVFDIDGTILDMRHIVVNTLRAFDVVHHTRHFHQLQVSDITMHENHVEKFIGQLRLAPSKKRYIHEWYVKHRWSDEFIVKFHQAYKGVFDLVRWLQSQPNTHVGLNTGRPEIIRTATLNSLNQLGAQYNVQFSDELLVMNKRDWEDKTLESKQMGLVHFIDAEYRLVAFIDNEPANLQAVENIANEQNILLLHAETLFETSAQCLPAQAVAGNHYDLQVFQQFYLR